MYLLCMLSSTDYGPGRFCSDVLRDLQSNKWQKLAHKCEVVKNYNICLQNVAKWKQKVSENGSKVQIP